MCSDRLEWQRVEWQCAVNRRHGELRTLYFGSTMKKTILRATIEISFIIFLFYSNLLMGEFEHSGMGRKRGLAWAIADVFTPANFVIAAIAAVIGYILVEFLRKRS
jgi:hypothetical protein